MTAVLAALLVAAGPPRWARFADHRRVAIEGHAGEAWREDNRQSTGE